MEPICILAVCLGLFAVLGCGRQSSRPEENRKKKGTDAVPDGTAAPAADLRKLFRENATLGKNMPEFDYGDEDRIVFHGYFGLIVCRRNGQEWEVFRALDLKRLGADATQGDEYAVIDGGRETACITPAYFATGYEDPVTYCYHYAPDALWEKKGYESRRNELLSWSYAHSMPVQERIDEILAGEGSMKRSSNIYPVCGISGGRYGFLAAEDGLLESLHYGLFREKEGELELFPLFRKGKDRKEE